MKSITIKKFADYVEISGEDADIVRLALFALQDCVWPGWYFHERTRKQYEAHAERVQKDKKFAALRRNFYDTVANQFASVMWSHRVDTTFKVSHEEPNLDDALAAITGSSSDQPTAVA